MDYEYKTELPFEIIKIIFQYFISNKLPKLYEMTENKLIEHIIEIRNLCDYFNIQIYIDYFNTITNNNDFNEIFDI